MVIPWGILISLAVVGLAYLIKHFVCAVIEEDNHFFGIITLFILIYIGAAILIGVLNPNDLLKSSPVAAYTEEKVAI